MKRIIIFGLICMLALTTAGFAQVSLTPYAHWHLNEVAGTNVSDASGNNRFGTTFNMTDSDWVAAKLNNGLDFDGLYDNISFGNTSFGFNWNESFSIDLWFNTSAQVNKMALIGKYIQPSVKGYEVRITGALESTPRVILVRLDYSGSKYIEVEGSTEVNDSLWHHLVMTYDGSGLASGVTVYLDNTNETLTVNKDTLNNEILISEPFQVGGYSVYNYVGLLDEIAIYDKELSAEEVAFRYNSGSGTESMQEVNTKPTITVNTANNTVINDSRPDINITVTDPEQATTSCTLFFNGSNVSWDGSVLNNTLTNLTTSPLLNGQYWAWVNCSDGQAINDTNVSANYSFLINVTAHAPSVVFNTANGTTHNTATPDINITVIDSQCSFTSCTLFFNGINVSWDGLVANNTLTNLTTSPQASGNYSAYVNCSDGIYTNISETYTFILNVPATCGYLVNYQMGRILFNSSNATLCYDTWTVDYRHGGTADTETNILLDYMPLMLLIFTLAIFAAAFTSKNPVLMVVGFFLAVLMVMIFFNIMEPLQAGGDLWRDSISVDTINYWYNLTYGGITSSSETVYNVAGNLTQI